MSTSPKATIPYHIPWHEVVGIVSEHVVRIATPRGQGTGFLTSTSSLTPLVAVATAAHVVDQSHYWEEPIRIDHPASGKSLLIRHGSRGITITANRDTAAIVFNRGPLPLPPQPLALAPTGKYLKVGVEIGWLGFPAIPLAELCFFSGRISAWIKSREMYLVDGVAINGVSGGPAVTVHGDQIHLMGVVSAYIPNRSTGDALPGLSVIAGVQEFHSIATSLKTIEEAITHQTAPEAAVTPDEAQANTKSEIS